MNQDNRSLHDLVRNALFVQNANLPVAVYHFSRDLPRLRTLLEAKQGEVAIARHPICVLFAARIAQLCGCEVGMRFERAHAWCVEALQNGDAWDNLPTDTN